MSMQNALNGIRVVDLSVNAPGPFASMMLADLGAEVTCVVNPIQLAPEYAGASDDPMLAGRGGPHDLLSRGKSTIGLNLKDPEDRVRLLKRLQDADILISEMRPGKLEALGLGWDDLSTAAPHLILCEITGYGETCELAKRAGHDLNYMAMTGALSLIRDGQGKPIPPQNIIGDYAAGGNLAVTAILAALIERGRTGAGKHMVISMSDGIRYLMSDIAAASVAAGHPEDSWRSTLNGGMPTYDTYPTSDGRWMAVGALEPKFIGILGEALEWPELAGLMACKSTWPQAAKGLTERFSKKTMAAWQEVFNPLDACVTPVLTLDEQSGANWPDLSQVTGFHPGKQQMTNVQPRASHFVDGEWTEDTSGKPIPVIYPATGEVIAKVYSATPAVIEKALTASRRAQSEWASVSGTMRGRILRRAADIIRERNHELSVFETYDTGKPLQETLVADATSGADALEYFGGLAGTLTGEHIPLGEDWAYTRREPLGVCAGIGAWNYPTQIACWKAAPALACGNAMIFKPSEVTPICALHVAEILHEAGLPSGLFNVVQGYGDVGAALVNDPQIAKVSLTGSVPTGRRVYAAAAEGLKAVTMELGGKSPMVVFPDADIDDAVSGAIVGNFYSSGQICSNGTRVFVHRGIREAFLDRLVERLNGVVMGDPLDPATNFGPMVSENQLQIAQGYVQKGLNEGARLCLAPFLWATSK